MSSFSQFTAELDTQYAEQASKDLNKDYWRVMVPFKYYIDYNDKSKYVNIELGYLSDGASVPQVFWNIIPPWGQYGQAAIVHDRLCETLQWTVESNNGTYQETITRAQCDKVLRDAMTVLSVPNWKVKLIYYAVSLYRILSKTHTPQPNPGKLQEEERWRAEYKVNTTVTA